MPVTGYVGPLLLWRPTSGSQIPLLIHSCKIYAQWEPMSPSFAHKLAMRAQSKGISIRFGMAAWWLAVNPSDLRNPLVLQLAGIIFSVDSMPAAAAAIRKMISVTSNPVAVAEFFHYLCNSLFLDLLRSGTDTCGSWESRSTLWCCRDEWARDVPYPLPHLAQWEFYI